MTTSRFETIRVSFRQDKEGYLIVLRIHPNDTDAEILLDPLGQRYYATLQRVDDDEQPVPPREKSSGEKLVQLAGIICTDSEFQKWLVAQGFALEENEDAAVKALRDILGVPSRADLKTNEVAQEAFKELLRRYGR